MADLPETGLFSSIRRSSATVPLPTRVSGGTSRVRLVSNRPLPVILPYPDTATPATGIPVAVSRVRPVSKRPSGTDTPSTDTSEPWSRGRASYNGSLTRHPRPQGALGPPCVSGWCRISPFPVILPYSDTITPATGTSVAGSRVRPPLTRPSGTDTPSTGTSEPWSRVRPVSILPSATAPLPTRGFGGISRVRLVSHRPLSGIFALF